MIDYKLETILLIEDKDYKFVVKNSDEHMTIKIPKRWIESMGWKSGDEVEISNAWWDKDNKCHKIQIQLVKKTKKQGKWAK